MSGLTTGSRDNANPTVHKTAVEASARSRRGLASFLDDGMDSSDEESEGDVDLLSFGGSSGDSSSSEGERQARSKPAPIEEIDAQEIFDLIRSTTDPEHPLTLEQLAVVSLEQCKVTHGPRSSVFVEFTPTIPHCSMATLIGLCLRVRLIRSLPDRFKIDIRIKPGSHESENALNKQLNDKERVAAALENNHLLEVVHNCLASAGARGKMVGTPGH